MRGGGGREARTKVALVQNRPVLGGNSSSEVRVWVCGATAHGINRYARETGIMGEMFVENQYRNPDGNPYLWDLIVLETVRAEPNITLFLNTDVHEVEADGDSDARQIRSVTGWMMGSERRIRFESPVFLDCTGTGWSDSWQERNTGSGGKRAMNTGKSGRRRRRTM